MGKFHKVKNSVKQLLPLPFKLTNKFSERVSQGEMFSTELFSGDSSLTSLSLGVGQVIAQLVAGDKSEAGAIGT